MEDLEGKKLFVQTTVVGIFASIKHVPITYRPSLALERIRPKRRAQDLLDLDPLWPTEQILQGRSWLDSHSGELRSHPKQVRARGGLKYSIAEHIGAVGNLAPKFGPDQRLLLTWYTLSLMLGVHLDTCHGLWGKEGEETIPISSFLVGDGTARGMSEGSWDVQSSFFRLMFYLLGTLGADTRSAPGNKACPPSLPYSTGSRTKHSFNFLLI